MAVPPGHTIGEPAAQLTNSQPCTPARPSGHSSTQLDPAAQVAEQLWSRQRKRQSLPGPQLQLPFAQVPAQTPLSPSHSTWHGPEAQSNSQLEPRSHRQVPFAHVPPHSDALSQVTWQGGLSQPKSHEELLPQVQSPLPQLATHEALSPRHSMWQGGAAQMKRHSSPGPQ